MTPTGRAIVAVVAILAAAAIAMADHTQIGAVIGFLGVATGYVFGDRNGEKRLAAALTELAAAERHTT